MALNKRNKCFYLSKSEYDEIAELLLYIHKSNDELINAYEKSNTKKGKSLWMIAFHNWIDIDRIEEILELSL